MILNNINFLSLLIIIVFVYLIYNIYQINNIQVENFRRRRRKRRGGGGFFRRIGKSITKKVLNPIRKKILKPINRRVLRPVANFFNIKKRLREERERKARERAAAAARREAARRLIIDNLRTNYQTNINNLNKKIKDISIPNLSKASQSTIKKINDSKKITNKIYIDSLKDDILTNYNNMIYN